MNGGGVKGKGSEGGATLGFSGVIFMVRLVRRVDGVRLVREVRRETYTRLRQQVNVHPPIPEKGTIILNLFRDSER